jgi:hypothetical protein
MQDNAAQFHWRLVGDDGGKLWVSSTPFGSMRDAYLVAADVRLHAGSAEGTAER